MTTLKKIEPNFQPDNHAYQVGEILLRKYSNSFHLTFNMNSNLNVVYDIFNNLLQSNKIDSTEDKLEIINILDEIRIQQETTALNSGQVSKLEIEIASQNLGKKSQSSLKK